MNSYNNSLILEAAAGKLTQRPPVWLMRQAGRVLPEYREVRKLAKSFKNMVKNPEMVTEVTLQPVDIFGVDAAIIFSDILVVPEAMGCDYEMEENTGPIFRKPIESIEQVHLLESSIAHQRLDYVYDAIKMTTKALNGRVPLIGFAGAPWTIFAYMIEGGGSKTFSKAKKWLYTKPEVSHLLLDKITQTTILYLKEQVKAGAALIQIFDSWAGMLSPFQYEEFALPYMSKICDALSPDVPVTLFAKGAFYARKSFAQTQCSVIGLDWTMPIEESILITESRKTLQGNLDPCALYGDFSQINQATKAMINSFGKTPFIANLGHGLYPDIKKESVISFVESVKAF